jgi:hypothetical protein
MNFKAKTEDQIREEMLLPEGEYGFEVISSQDKISKNGNAMIAVELGVFNKDGGMRKVKDYLLASFAFKLRHFCDCVGLLPQYQSGSLCAEDCQGRTGTCKVVVKAAEGNYPPKNEIKDYVIRPAKPLEGKAQSNAAVKTEEDNLPF